MGVNSNRVENFSLSPDLEAPQPAAAVRVEPLQIHKLYLQPTTTTCQALKRRLYEIFFPDDPLSKFKNQPLVRKLVLALLYIFPFLQCASEYNLKLLKSDVIAGITIASLAIPQGISYAKLADLPPIIGLYSSFVPPFVYAILGSSRDLAVGPVSIASLVMGSMLREFISPVHQRDLYLQLAFTATFFAGAFQASLCILRLGFIVDFLSKATLTGFMAGAAIIVSLQQLKGLLGIVHFTTKMGVVPVMISVVKHRTEWARQNILMGFCFLLFLLIARGISTRKPKLFWISAAAPLTSVALSTIIVFIFKAQNHGIKTIGHLQQGLNPPSANMLYFHGPFLGLAIKTGIVTGILALTEGIAVGRTFASLKDYHIDGNKEMFAIGLMNMAGSCTSCYITTGSFSRSAVNYNAGAKTVVSNIVMAATVLVTLLFLMPLFYYTPNVILATIIITAVVGLIDFQAVVCLWKVDKLDCMACLSAFLGVLFVSVQMGLAIAVGISIFKILIHVTRPRIVMLGKVAGGTHLYRSIDHYRDAFRVPSFLILSIESPIYFTNSTYLQERILRWVREEEDMIKSLKGIPLKCIILDMAAVTSIDTNGISALTELKRIMQRRSVELVLANPVGDLMEKLHKSNSLELFGSRYIYMTVGDAVTTLSSSFNGMP